MLKKKKDCYFCVKNVSWIDYKNVRVLRQFTDRFGRIKSKYYTGVCLKHQKQNARAIKRARIMALLPFVK